MDKDITKRIEAITVMDNEDKNALFKIIDAYVRDNKAKFTHKKTTSLKVAYSSLFLSHTHYAAKLKIIAEHTSKSWFPRIKR